MSINPLRLPASILAAVLIVAAPTVATASNQAEATAHSADSVGIGGAGMFIPASHLNGPFGAGGPFAALGGAGAFIPASPMIGPGVRANTVSA